MRKQDLTAVDRFPDGLFFMRCKEKDMTIDVNNGGMLNDADLIIWPQKMVDSINQLWMHEEGFIINKKSGLVIDVRGGALQQGKPLIQYAMKSGLARNQRWTYKDGFIFPSAAPDLVIDVRGGDFKETNGIFLNIKDLRSKTQQWLIQPFTDEKSQEELALLRPPPSVCTSSIVRPEEMYDSYRMTYIEKQQGLSTKTLTGAAAFKALKDHIARQKKIQQPIVTPQAHDTIQRQAKDEIQGLCHQQATQELIHATEQAALSYFAREYEE